MSLIENRTNYTLERYFKNESKLRHGSYEKYNTRGKYRKLTTGQYENGLMVGLWYIYLSRELKHRFYI